MKTATPIPASPYSLRLFTRLCDYYKIGYILLVFVICTYPISAALGQASLSDVVDAPLTSYDEIPVRVIIEGYQMFYINAIYGKNEKLYLNIRDLFNAISINYQQDEAVNLASGFIDNVTQTYSIDLPSKKISIGTKIINARNGLVKEMGSLFIESTLFTDVFDMTLSFNYRALTIQLKSNFELPLLKKLRIEKIQKNLSKKKGDLVADTLIKRQYHILKLGTMDYAMGSYQTSKGPVNYNFELGVGTEFLLGEADVSVHYLSQYQFDNRQLVYLWRWVDNDTKFIKQAQIGKISTQSFAFINAPVIGATIRNTPTTLRKASGYYTINDHTEPNWSVELYINNILVDYTRADASGLYRFKIPNVYGYTTLRLKFYGPLGEEHSEERRMNVPYTVMPAGEFEYGLSGGYLQDNNSSRFGRGEFNYGVVSSLTLGGGLEYLSSISNNPYIPFATATFQPFSSMTVTGEYAHGVKRGVAMNYYFGKDALLELDYTRYVDGQQATRFNASEERKIRLSIPITRSQVNGFARFNYTYLVYKTFSYNQGNTMLSAYYRSFSANSTTQFNWIRGVDPYVNSDIALSYRMERGLTLRTSAQYNLNLVRPMTYKIAMEKIIARGNISLSYEKNILYNDYYINFGLRFDLRGARTSVSVSQSKNMLMSSEGIQGSIAFGARNGYVFGSQNSSLSKGGILIYPFLDLNNNGKFDKGEPMVKITNIGIMGGQLSFSAKDSIVRIADLNSFTNYLVEFKDSYLQNIAWRFRKKTYQILIDPNQFKRVDIPVVVIGEVSGMIYLNSADTLKGTSGIMVEISNKNPDEGTKLAASVMKRTIGSRSVVEVQSEADGYFNYMGLAPGDYVATINKEQLQNLKLTASPLQASITVTQTPDGDVIRGVDFILKPISGTDAIEEHPDVVPESEIHYSDNDSIEQVIPKDEPKARMTSSKGGQLTIEPVASSGIQVTEPVVKSGHREEKIQVGAFTREANALMLQQKLVGSTLFKITVCFENGFYKVFISGFSDRKQAKGYISNLIKQGLSGSFVVPAKRE